jgi:hypothetical protein
MRDPLCRRTPPRLLLTLLLLAWGGQLRAADGGAAQTALNAMPCAPLGDLAYGPKPPEDNSSLLATAQSMVVDGAVEKLRGEVVDRQFQMEGGETFFRINDEECKNFAAAIGKLVEMRGALVDDKYLEGSAALLDAYLAGQGSSHAGIVGEGVGIYRNIEAGKYDQAAYDTAKTGITRYAASEGGKKYLATLFGGASGVLVVQAGIWAADQAWKSRQAVQEAVRDTRLQVLFYRIESDHALFKGASSGRKLGEGDPIPSSAEAVDRVFAHLREDREWREEFKAYLEGKGLTWPISEPGVLDAARAASGETAAQRDARVALEWKAEGNQIRVWINGLLKTLNDVAKARELDFVVARMQKHLVEADRQLRAQRRLQEQADAHEGGLLAESARLSADIKRSVAVTPVTDESTAHLRALRGALAALYESEIRPYPLNKLRLGVLQQIRKDGVLLNQALAAALADERRQMAAGKLPPERMLTRLAAWRDDAAGQELADLQQLRETLILDVSRREARLFDEAMAALPRPAGGQGVIFDRQNAWFNERVKSYFGEFRSVLKPFPMDELGAGGLSGLRQRALAAMDQGDWVAVENAMQTWGRDYEVLLADYRQAFAAALSGHPAPAELAAEEATIATETVRTDQECEHDHKEIAHIREKVADICQNLGKPRHWSPGSIQACTDWGMPADGFDITPYQQLMDNFRAHCNSVREPLAFLRLQHHFHQEAWTVAGRRAETVRDELIRLGGLRLQALQDEIREWLPRYRKVQEERRRQYVEFLREVAVAKEALKPFERRWVWHELMATDDAVRERAHTHAVPASAETTLIALPGELIRQAQGIRAGIVGTGLLIDRATRVREDAHAAAQVPATIRKPGPVEAAQIRKLVDPEFEPGPLLEPLVARAAEVEKGVAALPDLMQRLVQAARTDRENRLKDAEWLERGAHDVEAFLQAQAAAGVLRSPSQVELYVPTSWQARMNGGKPGWDGNMRLAGNDYSLKFPVTVDNMIPAEKPFPHYRTAEEQRQLAAAIRADWERYPGYAFILKSQPHQAERLARLLAFPDHPAAPEANFILPVNEPWPVYASNLAAAEQRASALDPESASLDQPLAEIAALLPATLIAPAGPLGDWQVRRYDQDTPGYFAHPLGEQYLRIGETVRQRLVRHLERQRRKVQDAEQARLEAARLAGERDRQARAQQAAEEQRQQEQQAPQAIRELYDQFRAAYERRDETAVMALLADEWEAGDGTTLADLSATLRRTFAAFDEVRYRLENLRVQPAGQGRYRLGYDVTISSRNYSLNLRHEEKSAVSEEVGPDSRGRWRILKTVSGRYWSVE